MDIRDIAQYFAAAATIATTVGLFVKWVIVKPIKAYIDLATYPIQPNANGGKSLPDLIAQVGELRDTIREHIDTHHR
jgi:hypothetical protein